MQPLDGILLKIPSSWSYIQKAEESDVQWMTFKMTSSIGAIVGNSHVGPCRYLFIVLFY